MGRLRSWSALSLASCDAAVAIASLSTSRRRLRVLSLAIALARSRLAGRRVGANAIRSRDEAAATVAKLSRALRLDATVEPTRSLSDADEDASSQRPDASIRGPRGLGRQATIDVAATGVDGQSRASDEAIDRRELDAIRRRASALS